MNTENETLVLKDGTVTDAGLECLRNEARDFQPDAKRAVLFLIEQVNLARGNERLDPFVPMTWVSRQRAQVQEFMRAAPHPIQSAPKIPSAKRVKLRARLIIEECVETIASLIGDSPEITKRELVEMFDEMDGFKPKTLLNVARHLIDSDILLGRFKVNLPEFADGCVDMVYVILGALAEFGINDTHLFDRVHEANMKKFEGRRVDRADGKTLKPEGWEPADIDALLRQQGWDGDAIGNLDT